MADTARSGFKSAKNWGTTVIGAFVIAGAFLSVGAGTAFADKVSADPSKPSTGPSVEKGVRASGSDQNPAIQGETRESSIATPNITAGSPQPGNLSDLGINCFFNWDNSCASLTTPPYKSS